MDDSIQPLPNGGIDYWRAKAKATADRIVAEDYYLAHWSNIRIDFDAAKTKQEILAPFQEFWEALPSSHSIRTGPFFDICDLAEEYCFGQDGDEVAAARTFDQLLENYTPGPVPTNLEEVVTYVRKQAKPQEEVIKILPRIDDAWANNTCKLGQGAACCRYLSMGAKGWSCLKHSSLKGYLDGRVKAETMNARGDNCEGRAE